jgi:hypothetical protein
MWRVKIWHIGHWAPLIEYFEIWTEAFARVDKIMRRSSEIDLDTIYAVTVEWAL